MVIFIELNIFKISLTLRFMILERETNKGKLCDLAKIKQMRRGRIALCTGGFGGITLEGIEMVGIPSEHVCIASYNYSTGHTNQEYGIDLEKMNNCDYCLISQDKDKRLIN